MQCGSLPSHIIPRHHSSRHLRGNWEARRSQLTANGSRIKFVNAAVLVRSLYSPSRFIHEINMQNAAGIGPTDYNLPLAKRLHHAEPPLRRATNLSWAAASVNAES